MQESSIDSFFKFFFGFLVFISVSFGVTFTVNKLIVAKDTSQAAAAAWAHAFEKVNQH
jgi:hypothetical protein